MAQDGAALERHGVELIPEGDGRGAGARYRLPPTGRQPLGRGRVLEFYRRMVHGEPMNQYYFPPPPDARKWPKKLWAGLATAVVGLFLFLQWLVPNWGAVKTVVPDMLAHLRRGVELVWSSPQDAKSGQAPVSQPAEQTPATKKAEPVKPQLPCVDTASDIYVMVRAVAVGGDKYEPTFNKHFRGRETCFGLTLTDVGTVRLQFVTRSGNETLWPPTFLVKPAKASDLKRFKPGTRLRISGELVRYLDLHELEKSDEIYVDRARLTEVSDADGSIAAGTPR